MRYLGTLLCILGLSCIVTTTTHAESLQIKPLEYRTTLKVGERQKGFVDVTNPTEQTINITITAQAFRQINDKGDLQFYDDPEVAAGIIPDYNDFALGPRQTIRLYFIVDGTKLPSGDVFAALFATTQPQGGEHAGVTQLVRIGTLLSIVNGTPGSRTATISDLNVPFLQLSDRIEGFYTIKNTADPKRTTGFYPSVALRLDPLTLQQKTISSLIYAGHSRTNTFSIQTSRIGFYKVTAQYGGSSQSRWVFVMTGIWRWLTPLVILLVVCAVVLWRKKHHKKRPHISRSV